MKIKFKKSIRKKIYDWIVYTIFKKNPDVLPNKWQKALHIVLFPLKSYIWYANEKQGYNLMEDVWIIEGQKYSNEFFQYFAVESDVLFRIIKDKNNVITFYRYDEKMSKVIPEDWTSFRNTLFSAYLVGKEDGHKIIQERNGEVRTFAKWFEDNYEAKFQDDKT